MAPARQGVNPLDAVQAGLLQLAKGDFHAAHEEWEAGWRNAQGGERELLQALAQLAAGFHQWRRGKSAGAATLFQRAQRHLGALPSVLLGVEVSELELQLGGWTEAAAGGEDVPTAPRLTPSNPPRKARQGQRARCPYCGEQVRLQPDALGASEETYVEDCPVCCRPWTVQVTREDDAVRVRLGREDD
jgi:hypothetical protein